MGTYTLKEIKLLKSNPYTFNVTKYKVYFTAKFKEDFWIRYQSGDAPRKILADLGYDVTMFGQKAIDSQVQRIKKQAMTGMGFSEGENRTKCMVIKEPQDITSPQTLERMQNELLYLRQEVEFLKNYKTERREAGQIIMESSSEKFQIIYQVLQSENNVLSVTKLCDIAGV
jgi:hypothetical protein